MAGKEQDHDLNPSFSEARAQAFQFCCTALPSKGYSRQALMIQGITGANEGFILAATEPYPSLHFNSSPLQPNHRSVTFCLNAPPGNQQPSPECLLCAEAVRLEELWIQIPFPLLLSAGLCLEPQPCPQCDSSSGREVSLIRNRVQNHRLGRKCHLHIALPFCKHHWLLLNKCYPTLNARIQQAILHVCNEIEN